MDGNLQSQQPYQHSSIDGRFEVYEGATAFWIRNLRTGEEKCMGDGVDMYTKDDGSSLWVGTPEFYDVLTLDIDCDPNAWMEAYFNEIGDEDD